MLAMPNENASRRTMNRFKEHRLSEIEEIREVVHPIGGYAGALMKCTDQFCSWSGWIPVVELVIAFED